MRPPAVYFVGLLAAVMLSPAKAADSGLSVPPTNRVWKGQDYASAGQTVKEGKIPLPLLSDPEGQKIFLRITAVENLAPYLDHLVPLSQRMPDFLAMMQGFTIFIHLYLDAALHRSPVHAELAQLNAFAMRAGVAGVQLSAEFIPTIPKDEKYEARMNGLKHFNQGLRDIFMGADQSVSQDDIFTAQDKSLLVDAMAETFPTFKTILPPEDKATLRKHLEARKATVPKGDEAKKIQVMLDDLGT